MIHIPNPNHDPALNLAAEEYILTSSGIRDRVLFFYINDPSVIIGRHQNTADEIDTDLVRANGISIVRRSSGGGAVYHDRGNLNYSLITPGDPKAAADFSTLLEPILEALHELGIPAELTGRNDLTLNGKKFSGNAYYHNRSGSVVHGTLLFDSDLGMLTKVLRPDPEKLSSKGIRSVRSRVCCLGEILPEIRDTEALQAAILDHFLRNYEVKIRDFSEKDMEHIRALADNRYRNNTWTYGESPAYSLRKTFRRTSGRIDFRAEIRDGMLLSTRFFGDYFTSGDIEALEEALSGKEWTPETITAVLAGAGWDECFPDFSRDEFIEAVFSSPGYA